MKGGGAVKGMLDQVHGRLGMGGVGEVRGGGVLAGLGTGVIETVNAIHVHIIIGIGIRQTKF